MVAMAVAMGLIAAATGSATMPAANEARVAWRVEGVFCEPETVLALPDDTLLVSNVCDFRKKGTGYLTLLNADGEVAAERAVGGLDSPLGMALHDQRLYVVDANRVRVFRWPGFEPMGMIRLATTVANDIAVGDDGAIYVSDTATGSVVRIAADGTPSFVVGGGRFDGANGVAIDGSRLWVGGARLWSVDLDSGRVETVGPAWLADIDGIELEADGTLQVTPVGGPLVRWRGSGAVQVLGGEGVSSANHGFAPGLGLALIPTGFDNEVIALRVPAWPADE